MPVTRGEKGELHLALEGQEEHGIRISQSTTLAYVREHFPVPPAYVFGVPTRLEKAYLATDFLPLMLLKSEDTLSGKLGGGAPPVDYKLERDRLMSEVAQLREKLAAARDAHADAQRAAATHTDRLETELAAARTRAQEADVAMQEARNLRERTTCVLPRAPSTRAAPVAACLTPCPSRRAVRPRARRTASWRARWRRRSARCSARRTG